jgi:glycosyltransferase involved in cell wall biosynthesis
MDRAANITRPTVSVVVPCRNEKDHIESCIRSILAQEPPPGGLEVVIADGMSNDGTRDVLLRLARENECLRVVDNPAQITACGMNAGIRVARGRYIAVMGAHNTYAPDYLRQCVETLEEQGVDNVGGAMICSAKSWLQRAIAVAHHSPFAVGGARWHDIDYEGPADTVFGGAYRREVFEQIGLFDEELVRNQDDEFNLRLIRAGRKIWQSPRIKSWYTPRGSLGALFRQYMQYGYWKVRVIQKHKLPASVRHLIPGCFVLSLILLTLAAPLWSVAAWVWLGVVGMYVVCNFLVSCFEATTNGRTLLPLLPFVFAAYHFGYGYGFLRGIWDFVILRRLPRDSFIRLTRATTDEDN